MYSILYCFISHQSVLTEDLFKWNNVCYSNNISDYLIVVGGNKINNIENNILYLDCDDSYEGLSDKIHKLFLFLTTSYKHYDFYAKLDRYIEFKKPVDSNIILQDYCGYKHNHGCRNWHFGKCSENSIWNTKLYEGPFVPWCLGGNGYFLSNKSANIVACNPPDLSYHIYEDLYVAQSLLEKANIKPTHLTNLTDYFIDMN